MRILCTFPQLLYPLSHGLSAEKDEEHRSRSHNEHDKAGKLSGMSRMSEPHCSQSCHAAYHPLGKRLYAVAQPVEPHLRLTAYNDYSCDIAYHVAGIIGYKYSAKACPAHKYHNAGYPHGIFAEGIHGGKILPPHTEAP